MPPLAMMATRSLRPFTIWAIALPSASQRRGVGSGGTYTFVARKKEVIRRRGENLSPLEVEAALEAHPAVVEVAVVGVPSELSEEDVKAFVIARTDVDASELRDFAADRLARFKLPRYIEFVDDLPHTATGRIAKHHLPRERSAAEHDLERDVERSDR